MLPKCWLCVGLTAAKRWYKKTIWRWHYNFQWMTYRIARVFNFIVYCSHFVYVFLLFLYERSSQRKWKRTHTINSKFFVRFKNKKRKIEYRKRISSRNESRWKKKWNEDEAKIKRSKRIFWRSKDAKNVRKNKNKKWRRWRCRILRSTYSSRYWCQRPAIIHKWLTLHAVNHLYFQGIIYIMVFIVLSEATFFLSFSSLRK